MNATLFYLFLLIGLYSCSTSTQNEEYHLSELQYASDVHLNVLNEAIESDPENDILFFKRAQYFFDQHAFKNALNDIQKALRIENDKHTYWLLSAKVYLELADVDKAMNDGLKAEQLGSTDPTLYIVLATAFIEKKDMVSAETYLNKVKSIAPHLSDIPYLEGLKALQQGDTITAKQLINKSIQLNKEYIDPYIVLMKLYYQSRNYDSIMPLLIKAKRVRPHEAELFLYEGKFYESLQRFGLAKIAYQEGLICNPAQASIFLPLSELYIRESNYTEAMRYLNLWLESHPEDKATLQKLGQYSSRNQDISGAITYYKTLYQLDTTQLGIKKEIEKLQKELELARDTTRK